MYVSHRAGLGLLAAALAAAPASVLACSSCGCTVGTEWAGTGYTTATGLRLDLRYDYVDQNALFLGSHNVDKAHYTPADPDQEVQQGTLTRFYTLGADYSINRDWGLNVQLPYLNREHETVEPAGTPQSGSHYDGIGDLRILARYQGFFEDRTFGVQFGIKLPTGAFHNAFNSGPGQGEQVDRGLQPGTGTTDLLLGVYRYSPFARDWDHFEELQLKQALDSREQFRPSTQVTATAGVRYVAYSKVVPQLQLNLKWEGRETGGQADYVNSGSRVAYLSPGATVRVLHSLQAYGFVQVPVYQYYTGLQLAPHFTATAGLSYSF